MKWFKENWTLVVVIIVAIILLVFSLRGCQSSALDRQKIAEQDDKIDILNGAIQGHENKSKEALASAAGWEKKANESKLENDELVAESKELHKQQEMLEEQIKSMTPDEVVLSTRKELETEEVELKTFGIVFSLIAAKKNLTILESFSLCKQGIEKLTAAIEEGKIEASNLRNAISDFKTAIIEKDGALSGWKDKETSWDEKFNLCQSQKKKNWWKGLGTGVLLGSGFVLALKLLLK